MCDGCDMYLVLCACIIYTYNTKQTCIHTQFIYYFSLCIKSIYRYMYINYNGSEIIYGELIWQSSGNICCCLKTIDLEKVVFCFFSLECVKIPALTSLLSCVVCIKAVDGFRALLYSVSLYRLCLYQHFCDSAASRQTSSLFLSLLLSFFSLFLSLWRFLFHSILSWTSLRSSDSLMFLWPLTEVLA